jgi:hypothetical protein
MAVYGKAELFDLADFDHNDIEFPAIARGLSNQCRFNGQTEFPYSVAQHSVHACQYGEAHGWPIEVLRWVLMHDAAEAYVGDLIMPIKWKLNTFNRLENNVMEAIIQRFGLHTPVPIDEIKRADMTMVYLEMLAMFPEVNWQDPIMGAVKNNADTDYRMHFSYWNHKLALQEFTNKALELGVIDDEEAEEVH